ncbi:hypothetical protein PISMIDRAFT_675694, partial [Pisolithus microcarpus 441]
RERMGNTKKCSHSHYHPWKAEEYNNHASGLAHTRGICIPWVEMRNDTYVVHIVIN